GELFALNDIAEAGPIQDLLEAVSDLIGSITELFIPDVITVDVMGIPDGLTIITAGLDISLWEVQLSQAAFDLILSSEGSTVSVSVTVIPGILSLELSITATESR
ncbi:MAG: hypothetical protein LUF04_11995, partial [Bacteroides sp.]|nr:hypothetical protein [Bacteroides sp.]